MEAMTRLHDYARATFVVFGLAALFVLHNPPLAYALAGVACVAGVVAAVTWVMRGRG